MLGRATVAASAGPGRRPSGRLANLLRRALAVCLIAISQLQSPLSASGVECVDYQTFLHWVGSAPTAGSQDVAVTSSYAYVPSYKSMRIFDVSIPAAPAAVGDLDITGRRVTFDGSLGFIAGAGLQILDAADPSSPVLIGSLPSPEEATDVAVLGQYAYVSDRVSGLHVIDISDPALPAAVGSCALADAPLAVAVSGGFAYVACREGGVQVVDVSIPDAPAPVGHYEVPHWAIDLVVNGIYAYVVDYSYGLLILDISTPTAPALVGQTPIAGNSYGLALDGDLAYVTSGASDPRNDHYGLEVVDIATPSAPVTIARLASPGDATGIAVAGGHAFVADYFTLEVADVSNPHEPGSIGSISIPGEYISNVALGQDVACVVAGYYVGEADLTIVDLANPASPVLAGTLDLPGAVAMSGDYAYVAGVDLAIVDLSNPAAPVILGRADVPGTAVALTPGYALVGDLNAGLRIVDVSNPAAPVLVGSLNIPVRSLAAAGVHACVSPGTDIQIIDISDPGNPVLVGTASVGDHALGVAMSGDLVYVADRYSGLTIVDISLPSAPLTIGRVDTPDVAQGVVVAGAFTYLTEEGGGMAVIESWLPDRPRIIGGRSAGVSPSMATNGEFLCMNVGQSLEVMGLQCPITPVELSEFTAVQSGQSVVLSWATALEWDHVGFLVHRSTDVTSTGVCLTPQAIIAGGPYTFRDGDVTPGTTYYYRLEALSRSGSSLVFGPVAAEVLPAAGQASGGAATSLAPSGPNPFLPNDPYSTIRFVTGRRGPARVSIFDTSGRLVRRLVDGELEAGPHAARWDGRNDGGREVGAGVYLYRLETDDFSGSSRLVRVR